MNGWWDELIVGECFTLCFSSSLWNMYKIKKEVCETPLPGLEIKKKKKKNMKNMKLLARKFCDLEGTN